MCSAAGVNGRRGYHQHHHHRLHCQPCRYIRLVHYLIERCLTLGLDRHECVRALAAHAGIGHSITATVWDELAKENPLFFHRYLQTLNTKHSLSRAFKRCP